MLIEFSATNFRSIKEQQVLSLAKSSASELEANSFFPDVPAGVPLLRSAALYGANASGKSNIIKAIIAMENIVTESAKNQIDDEMIYIPFALDSRTTSEPSEFEVQFIQDGIRYQYGFCVNRERVTEEWLFAYPSGRPQKWFTRFYDEESGIDHIEPTNFLKGKKSTWVSSTRQNALFLSTAVQLNSEQLKPVYSWFAKRLKVTVTGGWGVGTSAMLCEENGLKGEILDLLKSVDLGIQDFSIEKEEFDPSTLPDEIPQSARDNIAKQLEGKHLLNVVTYHQSASGEYIPFDLEDESDGTQRFFAFAGPWLDTLKKGNILVIDELHDTLHPAMVKFLVNLFNSPKTNPNCAQLVFTTHETSILNQDVFRRDQVWFCEKSSAGSTSLYSLTEFSPRKGTENIELGYLSGRYGAMPLIQNL